ncbi:hypothetical protein CHS0354_018327 [Potamilus streckersoni]|uniref:Protein FAM166B n=1 Tax=Potamilus streckersoni TaxID=2493646 RepID=A0AAE0VE98_9BIVA|nr:hypothetical protein CHS0354_018327 [Potamilus streckersoni]
MTTIEFGGGSDLYQRRSFAALRDGTHVPGYRGYCPQIKYRVGKTYGTDTHELAQDCIHVHPTNLMSQSQIPVPHPPDKYLPEATGDNRYTKEMVPGYTGYIPRMTFRFGGTYKNDCDSCLGEFLTTRKVNDMKTVDLKQQISSYPRLTAISYDPEVRDKLNMYRDTHPSKPILMEDRRPMTEPPIPGYRGYIPRIKPTELGLGVRYHEATKNGFGNFVQETAARAVRLGKDLPQSIDRLPREQLTSAPTAGTLGNRRLYIPDGMIPKYTGYIPHRRYVFGNTYGDTTRMLEVCAHEKNNYGEYVQTKPVPIRQNTVA